MANTLSLPLTGRHIAGIWHTSIVVFGRETYFGQGITVEPPLMTPHGNLVEKIFMGDTDVPEDVYWEYIDSLRSCAYVVCQFLLNKHIPEYITGLPEEFLATPFGQQMAPLIQSMYAPNRIAAEHRPQPELLFSTTINSKTSNHVHAKLKTPTLCTLPKTPILFSQSSNFDTIFGKLFIWIQEDNASSEDVIACFEAVKAALKASGSSRQILGLPTGWWNVFESSLLKLKPEHAFPIIDLMRVLILDDAVAAAFAAESQCKPWTQAKLITLLARFTKSQTFTSEPLPKSLHIMILRLCCNFFAHKQLIEYCLSLHHNVNLPIPTPHRTIMTATLVDALLSDQEAVRQCAASLAFNMAVEAALGRPNGEDSVYEEWCLEMVAALIKAVETEKSNEIATTLVKSLGHLLYGASEEVVSLASVLGCVEVLKLKTSQYQEDKLFHQLVDEI
ncbi:Desumoylating isopeptidase 1, partial [Physocladia obscura]